MAATTAFRRPLPPEVPMSAKALAAQLRADLGITGPRSKVRGGVYGMLGRYVSYGDMDWPYSVTVAMLGIDWTRATGRLSGQVEMAIRALSDWQMVALVADVAVACNVQGEVPRYLINRFAG